MVRRIATLPGPPAGTQATRNSDGNLKAIAGFKEVEADFEFSRFSRQGDKRRIESGTKAKNCGSGIREGG